MSQIKKINENENFTAVNVGKLSDLSAHSITVTALKTTIEGKVFLKDVTKSTGSEISYNILPPQTALPYFHTHTKNEETYLIIKGSGKFQVDEECFDITEGSVIRVAPAGKRGMTNDSDQEMIYIVVQSKENSLEEYSATDGNMVECEAKWN